MESVDRLLWPQEKLDKYDSRIRKGNVVVIMRDGHVWGKEENLPRFVIVKLPGEDVKTVQLYLEPHYENSEFNPDNQPKLLLCRRWRIPENFVDDAINAGGVITTTLDEIQNKIIDDG